jgi:hypothetical protein
MLLYAGLKEALGSALISAFGLIRHYKGVAYSRGPVHHRSGCFRPRQCENACTGLKSALLRKICACFCLASRPEIYVATRLSFRFRLLNLL